jgi:hypothetical protein
MKLRKFADPPDDPFGQNAVFQSFSNNRCQQSGIFVLLILLRSGTEGSQAQKQTGLWARELSAYLGRRQFSNKTETWERAEDKCRAAPVEAEHCNDNSLTNKRAIAFPFLHRFLLCLRTLPNQRIWNDQTEARNLNRQSTTRNY